MQNFEYCVPTKVVFGRDTESRCGELVRECGGTHALVVYGGGSAVRSGLLGRCTDSLKAAGIPYELLGGVQPNPRLSRVREGIALAKETGADFLLAVGGGSVIDTAKAIGYALANPEFDIWDLFMGKATAKACAPVGAVLTISAAGSETSNSCVITNEDGWLKKGVNYECSRPRFAIMNPALTCTLPPYQTASGGVDIMMHTMERYFSNTEHTELLDRMSEGLLKTVMANTKRRSLSRTTTTRAPSSCGRAAFPTTILWASARCRTGRRTRSNTSSAVCSMWRTAPVSPPYGAAGRGM